MQQETLAKLDAECNALFRELDRMKAEGLDWNDNPVYMQTLYTLRDKTRARLGILNGGDNNAEMES